MKQFVSALALLLLAPLAWSEVRLTTIFSDHMVLQRARAIPVWGQARAGEDVVVELNGQRAAVKADHDGRWRALLKAEPAGGPYQLRVKGDNTITLNDVLVGDVWLAGGQSNMEWSVAQAANATVEIAQSSFPLIRHIKVPRKLAFQPAADIAPTLWRVASPAHSGEFSAIGYYFARKLYQETGVPIGILNASWGGSDAEVWLSPQALASRPELTLAPMPTDAAQYSAAYRSRLLAVVQRWQGALALEPGLANGWMNPDLDDSAWPGLQAPKLWEDQGLPDLDGVVWYRRELLLTPEQAASTAILHLGTIDDCDETFVNGQRVGGLCQWDGLRRYTLPAGLLRPGPNVLAVRVTDTGGGGGFYGAAKNMRLQTGVGDIELAGRWRARVESIQTKTELNGPNGLPTLAFNAMLAPLTDFPLRGVIWYQGESNVTRARQYAQTFPLLIQDWRQQWHQPELPFYFVQLASYLPLANNRLSGSDWAELRDAQRQTLKLPGTGMVVATDVGDANDIHPRNKQAVGLRLALHALKNQYGQRKLVANGPVYRSLRNRGAALELSFHELCGTDRSYAKRTSSVPNSKRDVGCLPGGGLVAAGSDGVLRGFTVADASQQFHVAQARIQGNKVIVWHPDVKHPTAVRYGWVDNPEQNNLVNRAGLPASPFRTDDWPWLTEKAKYTY